MAQKLGLPPCRRRPISLAAGLHDIGKLCLPADLLHKPDLLTAEEYRQIQQHCVLGERLLAPWHLPAEVLAAIRAHHERLDGSGYPDGLSGDAIPWLARLIAVADYFDAMTSPRAYRAALTVPQALEVLRGEADKRLDGELVDLLVCHLRRKG
jgi:HD-GYP domain-containing protein (c-di-GMP phosphodiesterase class II)